MQSCTATPAKYRYASNATIIVADRNLVGQLQSFSDHLTGIRHFEKFSVIKFLLDKNLGTSVFYEDLIILIFFLIKIFFLFKRFYELQVSLTQISLMASLMYIKLNIIE